MHPLIALAATPPAATPVVLLVVGLAVLATGLVLLTGGRDRDLRPAVTRDTGPTPRPPVSTPLTPAAACDWSLQVDDDRDRHELRTPSGMPCCTYVLRVRELDTVPEPVDELDEALVWQGRATRVGPTTATTPLERDRLTRRTDSSVGSVTAALAFDHAPGPEVTTTTPTPAEADPAAAAAHLWRQHLDELHQHGAHPVPTDGARVTPTTHRRRVQVDLVVDRGCDPTARHGRADVACGVELGSARTGMAHPSAPTLAAWVEVGATRVAAERPDGDTGDGRWDSRRRIVVDPDRVTLVVGTAIDLAVDLEDGVAGPASAEVEARAIAGAVVRVGPDVAATSGCPRCVADLELVVGHADAADASGGTAGSTPDVTIGLDGHSFRLRPPEPGSGTRSWTVDAEVPGRAFQPATSTR